MAPPPAPTSIPPSPSLFVQNLNDKVKKDGTSPPPPSSSRPHSQLLPELRRSLYCLFSVYGKVLDVVHTRDPKVRGTAFVVFRDLASSTSALRGLDGEAFYGKQLVSPTSEASVVPPQASRAKCAAGT